MLRTVSELDRKKAHQCIDCFERVCKGTLDPLSLNNEKQAFIKNIRRLIELVEFPKIELCQKITNWDLSGQDCYEKVQIDVPKDPFSSSTQWNSTILQGHELRKVFKTDIWDLHLKKTIKSVFKRAEEKLKGKEITVTLISGGSSNIRWLEKLLMADFSEELKSARPIPLSESFQEIVAKGLAIECARRQYNPDSEFVSVTYNPIRLLLNSDDHGIEEKLFQSVDNKIDMEGATPGILIPAAQALHNFIGEPLQWKFKLSHPPNRELKYHFIRPSEKPLDCQPLDVAAIYNVDNEVYTPKDAQFDSKLRVELVIKKDGTAIPKFIYKTCSEQSPSPECSVMGKAFVVDMTSEITKVEASKYIGFDFGTSNSALCFLSNEFIETFETKSKDASWLELKDLISVLPYPVSFALKMYLSSSTSDHNQTVKYARQAFESLLTFAAYVAAAELATQGGLHESFKGYTQRSMGPLKNFLSTCLNKMRKKASFSAPLQRICTEYLTDIDLAIEHLTDHKHDSRSSQQVNVHSQLITLANVCMELMHGKVFGYIEQCHPQRLKKNSYNGIFRVANDSMPFVETLKYTGNVAFSVNEPLLVDINSGDTLSLLPFYFIEECSDKPGGVKFYVFDKHDDNKYKFKLADEDSRIDADDDIAAHITMIRTDKNFIQDNYNIKLEEQ